MESLEIANQRHKNSVKLGEAGQVVFEGLLSPIQSRALRCALEILGSEWIIESQFDGLKGKVSKIYWFIRLPYFFSTDPHVRLAEMISGIALDSSFLAAFLNPEQKALLGVLMSQLNLLKHEELPWPSLSSKLDSFGHRLLLVTEESKWASELSKFIESSDRRNSWTVAASLGYLSKEAPRDFDALVFLGNPAQVSESHGRLLLGSGIAPAFFALVPGFTRINSKAVSAKIFGILSPTAVLPSFLHASFSAGQDSQFARVEEFEVSVNAQASRGGPELEQMGTAGNRICRLLRIDDSTVIPIESDAARVFTLQLDSLDGQIKEVPVDWTGLETGVVVFALVSEGEQEFLWNAAKIEMGVRYDNFEEARGFWLGKLREYVGLAGITAATGALKSKGVLTAENLDQWLSNEKFARPRADDDFRALLACLELDEGEIANVMSLTSSFVGERIQVAKKARKLVCEALSAENWRDLQEGHNLDVSLEEFGDTVYRIGRVISISDEEFGIPANQVRRVVRG